ncbi:uncharacterized protein STEHIDRAFT_138652 [Stereum hirsutum FP-91666 SS1]|uniref:uncharacterized protein n=1 Tax=Stereum hirsutum (strain FP-91666) TaxID=721885 RepID=UPI000440FC3B|nr:uncharacterized protein STEHIDRAFT_138652 [Stereum hirsutum FP-91666 SS1]EIM88282.1 hypothetical protein STEHIDRAFT_138652 [Stereum hirsutum FP-91666 SS1]
MAKGKSNAKATGSSLGTSPKQRPTPAKPLVEIPEDEQWRLIQESGVLNKVSDLHPTGVIPPKSPPEVAVEEDGPLTPFEEEMFRAVTLIIPFSFLLLLMNIMINFQYKQQPDYWVIGGKMMSAVPILSIFIFYTTRHKENRGTQVVLFLLSLACGGRLIWQVNRGNWTMNMEQSPPLATIWVYTIVQLELGPAVLSLFMVGMWTYLKGLRITFN